MNNSFIYIFNQLVSRNQRDQKNHWVMRNQVPKRDELTHRDMKCSGQIMHSSLCTTTLELTFKWKRPSYIKPSSKIPPAEMKNSFQFLAGLSLFILVWCWFNWLPNMVMPVEQRTSIQNTAHWPCPKKNPKHLRCSEQYIYKTFHEECS